VSELRTTPLIQTLVRRSESVSCAESLTGGLVASELITPTGASEVVRGGIVAYATEAKLEVLKVPQAVISAHGTVSEETVLAMARAAQRLFDSTWALATTGVAGPGELEGYEAGMVFIGLIGYGGAGEVSRVERHVFPGSRDEVRRAATRAAVELLALELDMRAGTN